MKIIEKAKNVRDQISLIKTRSKQLDDQVHIIAVSCLYHAEQHGDVTLMQELIDSMGRSQRRSAVIAWAEAYGKFERNSKGKNVVFCRAKQTDLEGAKNESPWDFSPEPAFRPFDMEAELKKLLKRATKAAEDSRNNVPKEFISKIGEALSGDVEVKQLIEAMEGTEVPHVEAEQAQEAA